MHTCAHMDPIHGNHGPRLRESKKWVWGPASESQHLNWLKIFSPVQSFPISCAGRPPVRSKETGSNSTFPFPDPRSVLILSVMKFRHLENSQHECRPCPEAWRDVSQMSKKFPKRLLRKYGAYVQRDLTFWLSLGVSFSFQKNLFITFAKCQYPDNW